MNQDEAKYVNSLWLQQGPLLNQIVEKDWSPYDLLSARLWTKREAIAKAASTERVRLVILDQTQSDFPDRAQIDFMFGVELHDREVFKMTPLPIILELQVNNFGSLDIDIELILPDESSIYRKPFEAALLPLKHKIKEESLGWGIAVTLRTMELDEAAGPLNVDHLLDQLPIALLELNHSLLEPLARALMQEQMPQSDRPVFASTGNDDGVSPND
nr:hypothetical protein [uncultured Cohaesibacter sp.]